MAIKLLDYDDYIGKHVMIKYTSKSTYRNKGLVGMYGTVTRISSGKVGVLVDGERNPSSSYGVYWFDRSNLKILDNESEDIKMNGFKNVAIVKLLEDYNKKDYAFALYDEELNLLTRDNQLVIVNTRGENNRIVGTIQKVMSVKDYFSIEKNIGTKITAQVVGVVNMDGYIARVEEENRLKEIAKKKAEIEKALDAEIKKRKDAEYYEEMAKKYSDNPLIGQLVAELKGLGA